MAAGELLLELLSEEIPARMQRRAIADLVGLVRDRLAAAEIPAADIQGYVTPRRLAVIAAGIPAHQPDRREERRGPRVGAPQPAIDGFLRAAGVAAIEQCEIRDTGRGEFYFAVVERPGRAAAEVLPELLRAAIGELPWPRSMRFPASSLRWVRPLNSAICLFDGAILPLALDRVPVGRTTRGHRLLAEGEIAVEDAADYRDKLEAAYIVLDQNRRRAVIAADLDRLAKAEGLTVKPDPALLDEVTGLVEFPVVLMGRIDDASMALPPEVLATAMRTHQKYFSCLTPDGSPQGPLAPRFLFVANNLTADHGQTIVTGNERVLRARLADARFFWDQDRKIPLADRVAALKQRVYYDKLGTMYDKTERLERLAAYLGEQLYAASGASASGRAAPTLPSPASGGGVAAANAGLPSAAGGGGSGWGLPATGEPSAPEYGNAELVSLARRAARLAKADLSTGMVGEFPELQGVMGRYYALNDGEDPQVADAIAAHYKPLGPTDSCPTAPISIVVALADKIDALAGFFSIGEVPTGSRDPFALRRAALGLIRIILENNLTIRLRRAFSTAGCSDATVLASLIDFIVDRLSVHLREAGIKHDLISAAFLSTEDDLSRLLARVEALKIFLGSEDGADLLIGYRRAASIVGIEERRDRRSYRGNEQAELLREVEEKRLARSLRDVARKTGAFIENGNFPEAMAALAELRPPIDAFFDKVTVNTDDPALRENRLRLLSRIRAVMNQVADFSRIEG